MQLASYCNDCRLLHTDEVDISVFPFVVFRSKYVSIDSNHGKFLCFDYLQDEHESYLPPSGYVFVDRKQHIINNNTLIICKNVTGEPQQMFRIPFYKRDNWKQNYTLVNDGVNCLYHHVTDPVECFEGQQPFGVIRTCIVDSKVLLKNLQECVITNLFNTLFPQAIEIVFHYIIPCFLKISPEMESQTSAKKRARESFVNVLFSDFCFAKKNKT